MCAIKPISVGRSVSHLATCRVVYKISTCAVQAGVVQRVKVYTIVELLIVQVCSTLHTVGCIKSTTKYHPTWLVTAFERQLLLYIFFTRQNALACVSASTERQSKSCHYLLLPPARLQLHLCGFECLPQHRS